MLPSINPIDVYSHSVRIMNNLDNNLDAAFHAYQDRNFSLLERRIEQFDAACRGLTILYQLDERMVDFVVDNTCKYTPGFYHSFLDALRRGAKIQADTSILD